tara:strand:+ start:685 stop:1926 length:1242 start_codon:yes stop_codon:yes gene_type:complete
MKKIKKILICLNILILSAIMFGCMNDMQHQGNWASPSISNEVMIVPSNEGVLHKYSISQNSFDLITKFPSSDSKIGSFYGNIEIIDDVAYGISYGNDEGDKCQNKSCISYLFALDVNSLNSVWVTEFIQIDGAVVGGIKYSDEKLYFATTENDSFNEKGGFFYSVNASNGDIIFKIPISSRVYNSIEVNSEENIAIVGDAKGNISLYNISTENIDNSARKIFSVDTNFSIISPAIQLTGPNSEINYCIGNINGEIKCYELIKNNGYSITEWASLKFDGWIWSDIEFFNGSLFLVTLSGNFYKVDIDLKNKNMNIAWEQNINKNGKPLSGLMIYETGNVTKSIIPFDKDKLIVAELNNGSIIEELPFKDGVQSLPVMKNDYIYFVDKENKFRSYSLIDRSQKLCFDLKEMKGCD